MKVLVTFVDPPSGWQFGFPRPLPTGHEQWTEAQRVSWFIDQGYPEKLIAQGMLDHCRSWIKEVDLDD